MESPAQRTSRPRVGKRERVLSPEEGRMLANQENEDWIEDVVNALAFSEEAWPTPVLARFHDRVLNGAACTFVHDCSTGTVWRVRQCNPLVEHDISSHLSRSALEHIVAAAAAAHQRRFVNEFVKALRAKVRSELCRRLVRS